MFVFILGWNFYVPNLSCLRQSLWLLSSKTISVQVLTCKRSTLENLFFFSKMSNVCFYTLMKLKSSNFQLSTSIIVATLVKNMFWPLREVPLKMYFFRKMSNVCFYPLMKLICSKFQLSTSIIVAALITIFFFWLLVKSVVFIDKGGLRVERALADDVIFTWTLSL